MSVNGVPGGNTTYGTISASLVYTPPAVVPPDNVIEIRATSTAYPSIYGKANLTLVQPVPNLWGISPTSAPAGSIVLKMNGSNFTANAVVQVAGMNVPTTYISSTSVQGVASIPAAGTYAVRVVNQGNGPSPSAAASLTVTAPVAPVTVSISPTSASVKLSQTQTFVATVTNTANTSVTWSVNGVAGGNATVGTVSATGVYTAPATLPSPATVTVTATSAASPSASASAAVALSTPAQPPPATNLSAGRLLEQAGFGPASADVASVQALGVNGWLDAQFSSPATAIPMPADMGAVKDQFLSRLAMAPDQLRQKAIWALSQVIVISTRKNLYPAEIVPYLQILSTDCFGNYRTLLKDITLSSQMGKYLDMANSTKPGSGNGANENYARELMQLFTVGLVQLNRDGSPQLDASGQTIPTYSQATVAQMALALTGWTYPTAPGGIQGALNYENFSGPLEPRPAYHDQTQKTLLNGAIIPAGQTPMQDLDAALDTVFNHPNTGPFLATRLIRLMVTSNPTPGYVQRVAAAFNDNGAGVRGDLKAVFRAILTDAEARNDTPPADFGRLKDHVYFLVALTRALGGTIGSPALGYLFAQMGEDPLSAPSVFNFYSPMYHIAGGPLFGPEFQIYSPTESVLRGNLTYMLVSNGGGAQWTVNLAPFQAVASDANALADAVNNTLLYGRMPADVRSALLTAMAASYDDTQRMTTALYLTALSGQYAVQR